MNVHDQAPRDALTPSQGSATGEAAVVHRDGGVAADLDAWGHAEHLLLLRRVVASGADHQDQRCLFWCASCQIWQLARLADPTVQ